MRHALLQAESHCQHTDNKVATWSSQLHHHAAFLLSTMQTAWRKVVNPVVPWSTVAARLQHQLPAGQLQLAALHSQGCRAGAAELHLAGALLVPGSH